MLSELKDPAGGGFQCVQDLENLFSNPAQTERLAHEAFRCPLKLPECAHEQDIRIITGKSGYLSVYSSVSPF